MLPKGIDENTPAFAAKAQISDTSETNDTKDTKEEKVQGLLTKGMQLLKVILKRLLFTLMLIILIPAMLLIEMLGDSLAALFMLILWLRYMVMILFVGAVLNRVLEEEAISS